MTIGENILMRRKKLGIAREKIAKQCGISLSQLYRIENDIHSPSINVFIKIAKALNVSLDDLVNLKKKH